MHYVICYDLENDRRALFVLKTALRGLLNRHARNPADSIVLLPLRDGDAAGIAVLGANNVHPALAPPTLKIIL